jgi:hypothetical protein
MTPYIQGRFHENGVSHLATLAKRCYLLVTSAMGRPFAKFPYSFYPPPLRGRKQVGGIFHPHHTLIETECLPPPSNGEANKVKLFRSLQLPFKEDCYARGGVGAARLPIRLGSAIRWNCCTSSQFLTSLSSTPLQRRLLCEGGS